MNDLYIWFPPQVQLREMQPVIPSDNLTGIVLQNIIMPCRRVMRQHLSLEEQAGVMVSRLF